MLIVNNKRFRYLIFLDHLIPINGFVDDDQFNQEATVEKEKSRHGIGNYVYNVSIIPRINCHETVNVPL